MIRFAKSPSRQVAKSPSRQVAKSAGRQVAKCQVVKSALLGWRKTLREDWAGIVRVAMPASGHDVLLAHPTG